MKKFLALAMTFALAAVLVACGSDNTAKSEDTDKDIDTSQLIIDKDNKSISMYAEVNGQFFTESTRHGVVYQDGGNKDVTLFRAYPSQFDFYDALEEIGAKPGDNLSLDDLGGTVDGSKLDVTVSWDGSDGEIPFAEVIKTSSGEPYKVDARFGGMLEAAKEYDTGCIFCLESCPAGISSNAAYPFGVVDEGIEQFMGNGDILPKDGSQVKITFTLAD